MPITVPPVRLIKALPPFMLYLANVLRSAYQNLTIQSIVIRPSYRDKSPFPSVGLNEVHLQYSSGLGSYIMAPFYVSSKCVSLPGP